MNGKGDRVVFAVRSLEAWIPADFFSSDVSLAEAVEERVEVMGIFPWKVVASEGAKPTLMEMGLASRLTLFSSRPREEVARVGGRPEAEYQVMTYMEGEDVVASRRIIQSAVAFADFVKMVHSGRLPEGIEYPNLLQVYRGAVKIHGSNVGVPSLIIEAILSELCRGSSDKALPFRFSAGKGEGHDLGYRMVNVVEAAKLSGTFGAMTFQDFDNSAMSSLTRTLDGRPEASAPIERTIRY
jgi:hypothetical protein